MSSLWQRQWPAELARHLSNPKAVALEPGSFPRLCPNCGGVGLMALYLIHSGPFDQPVGRVKWLDLPDKSGWYNGEMMTAPCPICRAGQRERWLTANCGLDESDLKVSLSDFTEMAGKDAALRTAQKALGMNQQPIGFVTFYGRYGVGKTHLLMGLVNGFRKIGVTARYWRMADLLGDVRERFGDGQGVRAVEQAIDDLKRARVLCLDEVDRVNLTGWAKETMFRLLDARYNERDSLLTALALNNAPANLPAELGYLTSRMNGGMTVEVGGLDMRPVITSEKGDYTDL